MRTAYTQTKKAIIKTTTKQTLQPFWEHDDDYDDDYVEVVDVGVKNAGVRSAVAEENAKAKSMQTHAYLCKYLCATSICYKIYRVRRGGCAIFTSYVVQFFFLTVWIFLIIQLVELYYN